MIYQHKICGIVCHLKFFSLNDGVILNVETFNMSSFTLSIAKYLDLFFLNIQSFEMSIHIKTNTIQIIIKQCDAKIKRYNIKLLNLQKRP